MAINSEDTETDHDRCYELQELKTQISLEGEQDGAQERNIWVQVGKAHHVPIIWSQNRTQEFYGHC